jgi:hypothetical protein
MSRVKTTVSIVLKHGKICPMKGSAMIMVATLVANVAPLVVLFHLSEPSADGRIGSIRNTGKAADMTVWAMYIKRCGIREKF